MVLYIIGLGLGDEKDITVKGLEIVRRCKRIYIEYYTSVLGVSVEKLEKFYEAPIILADRNMVESEAEEIYENSILDDIAFLVVGDPLCATTHTDLILRAKKLGIPVQVIHNASVMGAAASCGLQLYQFGYTVSIPLYEENWQPTSFYDRIKNNAASGLHTLCLLDIKMKEPDPEAMKKGKMKMLPPRFMTITQAIEQLFIAESIRNEGVITKDVKAVGMARLGQETQKIVYGSLDDLLHVTSFGGPLHCMALCGSLHPLEIELLEYFQVAPKDLEEVTVMQDEEGCDGAGQDNDDIPTDLI